MKTYWVVKYKIRDGRYKYKAYTTLKEAKGFKLGLLFDYYPNYVASITKVTEEIIVKERKQPNV